MELIFTKNNIIIAVNRNKDGFLISDDNDIISIMDGEFLSDNNFTNIPQEPGIYNCDIEYWFSQGYLDGYPCDSESDIEFRIINIKLFRMNKLSTVAYVS